MCCCCGGGGGGFVVAAAATAGVFFLLFSFALRPSLLLSGFIFFLPGNVCRNIRRLTYFHVFFLLTVNKHFLSSVLPTRHSEACEVHNKRVSLAWTDSFSDRLLI